MSAILHCAVKLQFYVKLQRIKFIHGQHLQFVHKRLFKKRQTGKLLLRLIAIKLLNLNTTHMTSVK